MASIIQGYEYDIFISYRQKDNKHDGWVTEFVDNLKGELESTFKEEINVYFDINPHDGLLETHDVDASLKDKLKCLVFIPIISRTYCDPKSFAWEHEFKAFAEFASQDQFGLKVKLPNGNVVNRILPIRIHDLDSEDIKLCESVMGGVLRGVEFIYNEAGVNRSLSLKDNEDKNLNRTSYRNQMNKVALAIKEIIAGLKKELAIPLREKTLQRESSEVIRTEERRKERNEPAVLAKRILSGAIILAFFIAIVLIYPKIFKRDKLENIIDPDGRISVAVMPFQNLTNDTIWNVWQYILQDNLINYLSNYTKELRIIQVEHINNYIRSGRIKNKGIVTKNAARIISDNLNAEVMINGSITMAGDAIRLNAQLLDCRKDEAIKTFELQDRLSEKVMLKMLDSLRKGVRNYLIISRLEMDAPMVFQQKYFEYINSPDAYRYFIYGQKSFWSKDFSTAKDWYLKAIQMDSNFFQANAMLPYTYEFTGSMQIAKQLVRRLYLKRDAMTVAQQIRIDHEYAHYFGTLEDRIKYARQYEILDDQEPVNIYTIASNYFHLGQFDLAIPEFEKALVLYDNFGYDPSATWTIYELGIVYHKTGQLKKEKNLYIKAEKEFPDNLDLIYRQAILSLTEGDDKDANRFIEKYRDICKKNSWTEADIVTDLAKLYSDAGIPEKGEKYFRQALLLAEPASDNSLYLNNLARFLIDNDRNINEGLELIKKPLDLDPDNYEYLDTEGWGLYKQGKYQEAYSNLQKSWDLRMENDIYNHEAYLHLEAAKKAVANQKYK